MSRTCLSERSIPATHSAFFDIDNSGSISATEFLRILTQQHSSPSQQPITLADAQELLVDFDTDGNGVLDVEEFIQAMMSMDPELQDEMDEDDSLFAAADAVDTAAAATNADDEQNEPAYS